MLRRLGIPALVLVVSGALFTLAGMTPSRPARLTSASVDTTQTDAAAARATQLVAHMNVWQKAGQVIVAGYPRSGTPATLVEHLHLGGMVPVLADISSVAQVRTDVRAVRRVVGARGYPAFVGIDQEGGNVVRLGAPVTDQPAFMTAGATRRPDLTRAAEKAIGAEMRGLGFTVVFAPDADLTIGPADPVIGTRSPSAWPGVASPQVLAAVEGLSSAGVLPVVKHFPGHGSVTTDSHLGLPLQTKSLSALRSWDFIPFQRAAQADAPAVMTGHIALQAVDPGRPASLSYRDTHVLLRGDLGFHGLVVTDALGMAAVRQRFGSAGAAVAALRAGADVVLMPPDPSAARTGIVDAVRSGAIPMGRLDQAAERMIAALLRLRAVDPQGAAPGTAAPAMRAWSGAAVSEVAGPCGHRLVGASVRVSGPDLAATRFRTWARKEGLGLGSGRRVVLSDDAAPSRTPDVLVALDRPNLLGHSTARVRIATYDDTSAAMHALVKVLLGKASAPGRLPVPVGHVPRRGC